MERGESRIKEEIISINGIYTVTGTVQAHRGRGTKLGFPTVNLALTASTNIPHGVYAGYVAWPHHRQPAAIFVGPAITFDETDGQIEAYLLDWSGDLSNTAITIELQQWVRENQKFTSASALQQQINLDIKAIRQCLLELSKN